METTGPRLQADPHGKLLAFQLVCSCGAEGPLALTKNEALTLTLAAGWGDDGIAHLVCPACRPGVATKEVSDAGA